MEKKYFWELGSGTPGKEKRKIKFLAAELWSLKVFQVGHGVP